MALDAIVGIPEPLILDLWRGRWNPVKFHDLDLRRLRSVRRP
jgi:hypothetical protein